MELVEDDNETWCPEILNPFLSTFFAGLDFKFVFFGTEVMKAQSNVCRAMQLLFYQLYSNSLEAKLAEQKPHSPQNT
jgi:hypothetical protein